MRISFEYYKNSILATMISFLGSAFRVIGFITLPFCVVEFPLIFLGGLLIALGFGLIKLAETISELKSFLKLLKIIKKNNLDEQIKDSVDIAEFIYNKCPNFFTKKYLLKLNPDLNNRFIKRDKEFRERVEACRINTQNETSCVSKKKGKAKKLLLIIGSVLLSFILIIFATVMFSDESDINSSTYDSMDDPKTEYTVGYTVDECYFNEWCKIKFQIPNGWSMVEGADEFDDQSKIATALSYENEHNLVSMYFDRTIGNNTTTDDYLLAIEEQLKDDYSVNGVSVDSTEIYDFLIADTNFRTIKISLADGMCYQYFCARQIDNCIILIDVFAESITEAEKIFNMFEYYEG